MRALTIQGPGELSVADVAEPELLGPNDVIVRVDLAGICGSDLYLHSGRVGIEPDFVVGHEFMGTVLATGDAVEMLDEGDRVAGSFMSACGHCRRCREGSFLFCPLVRFFGFGMAFGDLPGVHAERVLVPNAEHTLLRLDDELGLSDEQAVLLGDVIPSAVDILALTGMTPGDTVAILGAGPVGIVTAQVARALGASAVVIADKLPDRLKLAEAAGAITVDVTTDDMTDAVMEATNWQGADIVVEATATLEGVSASFALMRSGGTLGITSIFVDEELTIPLGEMWLKGQSLVQGIANVQRRWDVALDLLRSGAIAPETVIAERVSLDGASDAFARFAGGEISKAVIDPRS